MLPLPPSPTFPPPHSLVCPAHVTEMEATPGSVAKGHDAHAVGNGIAGEALEPEGKARGECLEDTHGARWRFQDIRAQQRVRQLRGTLEGWPACPSSHAPGPHAHMASCATKPPCTPMRDTNTHSRGPVVVGVRRPLERLPGEGRQRVRAVPQRVLRVHGVLRVQPQPRADVLRLPLALRVVLI